MSKTVNKNQPAKQTVKPEPPKVETQQTETPMDESPTSDNVEQDLERKDGAVENTADNETTSPLFEQENEVDQSDSNGTVLAPSNELPEPPKVEIPQTVREAIGVDDNGKTKLLNQHGKKVELPTKTANFLLKRYPNKYSKIAPNVN